MRGFGTKGRPTDVPPSVRHRLTLVSGPQGGAWTDIDPDEGVAIGRSLDSDVVLADPAVDERQLTLSTGTDGALVVSNLGTPIDVDGRTLASGESATLTTDGCVSCGDTVFRVEREGAEPVANASAPSRSPTVPAASYARLRPIGLALGALLVAASLSSALWLSRSVLATVPEASFESRLHDAFPGLAVERGDGGVPVVVGALPDRERRMRLSRLLDAEPGPVEVRVVVESVLAEAVLDVFRVNGVGATLRSVRGGTVSLGTAVGDTERLETVRLKALRDVAMLETLDVENAAPAAAGDGTEFDPGKRVALVVTDPPAHLVTEDRSRYFLGALLPSGHRIASIDRDRVMLEKAGVATELRF